MITNAQHYGASNDGVKELANKASHAARTKTALINLRNDCVAERGMLTGLLTEAEIATLTEACFLIDKIAGAIERDAAEAKRIKAARDKRGDALVQALRERTDDSVAHVVALMAINKDRYGLQRLARDCRDYGGVPNALRQERRNAISSLAHRACALDLTAAAWAAGIVAEMPAHAEQQAALIAEINTIAVQQRLEQANRKEPAHA